MDERPRILYVDDEEPHRVLFEAVFEDDYEILTAGSGRQALEVLRRESVHLLITDQRMPGMTGLELLQEIRGELPDIGRMILTAYLDIDAVISAINTGRIDYYTAKPWDEEELKLAIDRSLADYRRRMRQHRRVEELERDLARERALRRALQKHVPQEVLEELAGAGPEPADE